MTLLSSTMSLINEKLKLSWKGFNQSTRMQGAVVILIFFAYRQGVIPYRLGMRSTA
jgi:hypothetical protein